MSKYLVFGNSMVRHHSLICIQTSVKGAQFVWLDSFTKQRKVAAQPMLEMYSSIYNYAVTLARIACYMDLAGDGIKEASKLFQ